MNILELREVRKTYRGATENVEAVAGVSLTIASGEILVLYGPSGSGKSTLLLLAAGVHEPDAGTVLHAGEALTGWSDRALARRLRDDVGIAYQDPTLLPGVPAVENAAIKLLGGGMSMREGRRAAIPWLVRVGLGSRLHHTPEQLSGGERQRVALARALVGAPRLVLLDEPTGSLDSRRGGEILDLIATTAKDGAGVLLATHDPAAARIAHRVHELHDGHLQSAPQRLMAAG